MGKNQRLFLNFSRRVALEMLSIPVSEATLPKKVTVLFL